MFYLTLVYVLSDFGNTLQGILLYTDTFNWAKFSFSLVLTLLIAVLISLNVVFIYTTYRKRQACRNSTFLTGTGTLGGIIVGICPLCIGGIFPIVFGFFGVSFSFGLLPFQGIEIQLLLIALLLLSLWILTRNNKKHVM